MHGAALSVRLARRLGGDQRLVAAEVGACLQPRDKSPRLLVSVTLAGKAVEKPPPDQCITPNLVRPLVHGELLNMAQPASLRSQRLLEGLDSGPSCTGRLLRTRARSPGPRPCLGWVGGHGRPVPDSFLCHRKQAGKMSLGTCVSGLVINSEQFMEAF